MSDDRFGALLTGSDVAGLLRRFGVEPQDGSPLGFLDEASGDRESDASTDAAAFGDEWSSAISVLAAPDRQVRAIIPGPAETLIQIFYGNRSHSEIGLVGCWLEGEGLRVTFPWSEEDVAAITASVVLTTPPPLADGRSISLSIGGLEALAGSIDVMRDRLFSSISSRRPTIDRRFDREDVRRQLETGAASEDARWLVTLLRILGPAHRGVSPEEVTAGFDELAAAGIIIADDGRWVPSRDLIDFAIWWRNPLPAVAHEVIETNNGHVQRYDHRITIRGDGPLTRIDYENLGSETPTVTIRSLDAADYVESLNRILAGADGVESAWVCVLDPTEVFDLHDPSAILGSMLPGRWYLLVERHERWARVADPDGMIDGWAPVDALHIAEESPDEAPNEPEAPDQIPGEPSSLDETPDGTEALRTDPPREDMAVVAEGSSGGGRGWRITGIVALAIAAVIWLQVLITIALDPRDIGEMILGGIILTAVPLGFGTYALKRGIRGDSSRPSNSPARQQPANPSGPGSRVSVPVDTVETPIRPEAHSVGGEPPVDDSPEVPGPTTPAWVASHVVSSGGIRSWVVPDGSTAPLADLAAGVELQVVERRMDWARVRAENGWEAWVDGRLLTPVSTKGLPAPPPPTEDPPAVGPPS